MQAIGLTGGIGSGKTTVAQVLKHLGYAVYIADTAAGRLMNTHSSLRQQLIACFGASIYHSDHTLNKPRLAELIFNNRQALADVNRLVHPCVMEDFEIWKQHQSGALVFFESAILFESGLYHFFKPIICVTAPLSIRICRVMKRDRIPAEKVEERLANQWEEAEKCKLSDFVISNDDHHPVVGQILDIMKQLETEKP